MRRPTLLGQERFQSCKARRSIQISQLLYSKSYLYHTSGIFGIEMDSAQVLQHPVSPSGQPRPCLGPIYAAVSPADLFPIY